MAGALTTLKATCLSAALRGALDAALTAADLPPLAAPLLRHRRLLDTTPGYPAVAVELAQVTGRPAAAGGLAALSGEVTWWLAWAAGDPATGLAQLEAATDALRAALETALAGEFQRFWFAGATVEGEVTAAGALTRWLAPLRFGFLWLYEAGTP